MFFLCPFSFVEWSYHRFSVGNRFVNRIKLLLNHSSYNEEIDAIVLVGKLMLEAPTPAPVPTPPTMAPTPVPPTPAPTPAPVCAPASTLNYNSNIDTSLGDFFCVGTVCQWACVVNGCTSSFNDKCSDIAGVPTTMTGWFVVRFLFVCLFCLFVFCFFFKKNVNSYKNCRGQNSSDPSPSVDVSFDRLANATGK